MVQGFNTDIDLGNIKYHVQTEDWGVDHPYFITSIFKAGILLKSIKVAYRDVFETSDDIDFIQVRSVLKTQHSYVLNWVRNQFEQQNMGRRDL